MTVCPTSDGKKILDEQLGIGEVIEKMDFTKPVTPTTTGATYFTQGTYPPVFHSSEVIVGPAGTSMKIADEAKGISAANLSKLNSAVTPEELKVAADNSLYHISLSVAGVSGDARINRLAENMRISEWDGTDLDNVLSKIEKNMTQSVKNVDSLAELRKAREITKTIGGSSFKAINAKTPEELASFLASNGEEIKWMSPQNIEDIAVNPNYGKAIMDQHVAEWQKTFATTYKDFYTSNADTIDQIFSGKISSSEYGEFAKKLDGYSAQYGSDFTRTWDEATRIIPSKSWIELTNSSAPISSSVAQSIAAKAVSSGALNVDTPIDAIMALPNASKTSDMTALAAATRDDSIMQVLSTKALGNPDAIQILNNLKKLDSVANKIPAEFKSVVQSRIMTDGLTGAVDLKYGIYGDIKSAESSLKSVLGEEGYKSLNLQPTWADSPLRTAKSILTDSKLDPTEVYYKLGKASEPTNMNFLSSLPEVTDVEMAGLKKTLLRVGQGDLYKAVERARIDQTYVQALNGTPEEIAGFLGDGKFTDMLGKMGQDEFRAAKNRVRAINPDVADQMELARARVPNTTVSTASDISKQYTSLVETTQFLAYKKSEAGNGLLSRVVGTYSGKPVTMNRLVASSGDLDAVGRNIGLLSDSEFEMFLKVVDPKDVEPARLMRDTVNKQLWSEYQDIVKENVAKTNSIYAGSVNSTDSALVKSSSDIAYRQNYIEPIQSALKSGAMSPLDARTAEQIVITQRKTGEILSDADLVTARLEATKEVIRNPDELYRSINDPEFIKQASRIDPTELKIMTDSLPEGSATDLVRSVLKVPIEINGLAPSAEVNYIEHVLRNGTVSDIRTMLSDPKYADSVWQINKSEFDRFNRLYDGMSSPTYQGIRDDVALAYNGGIKPGNSNITSLPSSLLDGTPEQIRSSLGFDSGRLNVPSESKIAFGKELTDLSDLKFEEKLASIHDPDLVAALRDARGQEIASQASLPALISDPVRNASKLTQELDRVGGVGSVVGDDPTNIVDVLKALGDKNPEAYDAFMNKLKDVEPDLYNKLRNATQTEFKIETVSAVEVERLGEVAQAEEAVIDAEKSGAKTAEIVSGDAKAEEITAAQGVETAKAQEAVANAATTEEREVARQAWKKFSTEESANHFNMLTGDTAEGKALRDRIAVLSPNKFDAERSDLFNKYGQNGSQLINEYQKIHWEGTENVKGLADRLLSSDRLSEADKELVNKIGDKLKNPSAYWTKADSQKFVELIDKVDRGTAYWMLMWAVPTKIKGSGAWMLENPLKAVGLGITIIGMPSFFGFILEEGFQTAVQMGTFGMDPEQQAVYFEEHGLPSFNLLQSLWSPFAWMLDNVPFAKTIFFASESMDFYIRSAAPSQLQGKLKTLEETGLWMPSTANGGMGQKATTEWTEAYIIANPRAWGSLGPTLTAGFLDLRTNADGSTGIGPNNIFAKGKGLSEEDAIKVGEGGFAAIADMLGANSFKDTPMYNKVIDESGSLLWNANKAFYLANGITAEEAKATLDSIKTSLGVKDTTTPDGSKTGTTTPSSTTPSSAKPVLASDPAVKNAMSNSPSQTMSSDEVSIHGITTTMDKSEYMANVGKYSKVTGAAQARAAELKYYTRPDGSLDVAKFTADHPGFTYADMQQIFDDSSIYAGFRVETAKMDDAEAFKYVAGLSTGANPIINANEAANLLPGDKQAAYQAWLENPKNSPTGVTYSADGNMTYTEPNGYVAHKSLIADGKTGVYNPVTGDYSIPFTKTDADSGRVDTFNISEYAKWLTANPGKSVSDFLASDKAYTCTYKCDAASSSGSSGSKGGGSGSSYGGKSSSSSTGTPGIFIDAGGLKADVSENGSVIGTTDTTIDLNAGQHTLTISKTGYKSRTIVATIKTSVYNTAITLYADSTTTTTGTFNHGICDFIEGIGGIGNLTPDMYMLLYYKYKAYITGDAGWTTLYNELYAQIGSSMGTIPTSIYKDDLTYLYGQMMGDTTTNSLLAKVCPLG